MRMTLPASTRSLGSWPASTTRPALDELRRGRHRRRGRPRWGPDLADALETVSLTVLPASTLPGAGSWASTVPAGWSRLVLGRCGR